MIGDVASACWWLLLVTACVMTHASATENLVPNGEFESWDRVPKEWRIEGDTKRLCDVVGTRGHAVKLGSLSSPYGRVQLFSPSMPIDSAKSYGLSFDYRTAKADVRWTRITCWFTRNGQTWANQEVYLRNSEAWTHRDVELIVPRETDGLVLELRLNDRGEVSYDNLRVVALSAEERARVTALGKMEPIAIEAAESQPRMDATGRFNVCKVNGVDWLVDPKGEAFWNIGICGIGGGTDENPALLKALVDEFGSSPSAASAYAQQSIDRAQAWGINSEGGWTGHVFHEANAQRKKDGRRPMPYFLVVESLDRLVLECAEGVSAVEQLALLSSSGRPTDSTKMLADVFNDQWRAAYDRTRRPSTPGQWRRP